MKDLNNITIAIIKNGAKKSDFGSQIESNEIDFSSISQSVKTLSGTIDEISNQIQIDFAEKTSQKELQSNDAILFMAKTEEVYKILEYRLNPETEYDWVKTSQDFLDNVLNTKPDSNNYWKWGQIVQESGEFMCIDCGLIVELEKGDVFPICEVCLSGDPSAPDSKSDEGFWELV